MKTGSFPPSVLFGSKSVAYASIGMKESGLTAIPFEIFAKI